MSDNLASPPAPPKPRVSCPAEWDMLSDADRAAELARFQTFWLGRASGASAAASGGPPIEITPVPEAPNFDDRRSCAGANPAPTKEQLASVKNWNRF
jgi:hypothetical protein